jgi:hypothetical protein
MKLKSEELESIEELQDRVKELPGQVTSKTMQRVYEHWIERLSQVIHIGGTTSQANSVRLSSTSEE